MPNVITVDAAFTWVAVGFCVGLGWALAAWLVAKVLR